MTLIDSWPAGFSQGTISPSQGDLRPVGAGPDFSCSLGLIAAGGSATVSVAYTVPASIAGGIQTTTVSVDQQRRRPVAADNTATDADDRRRDRVLVVTKDDGQTSVVAGTSGFAYTISVTNTVRPTPTT